MRRDRTYDGRFVTGVLTTGIYCRPSCAARHPGRANVRFFTDCAAARAAGLRACKRCLPDDVGRDEAAARALREERARNSLSAGESVTGAIYEAGYGSASRFYENTKGRLGMTASAWANGGAGVTINWAVVETSMGPMLVAATQKGVCRLSFGEDESELARRFPKAELVEGGDGFAKLLAEVVASVEAPGDFSHIPLDVKGTAFQEACWDALRAIPPGETRTYSEIAAAAGNAKAVRAAGSANARNNVAVLIPCHRVVRKGGDLGGYAYGPDIKRELLKRERR